MFPEHRQQALDMEKAIQMKKALHTERPRSPPTNEVSPQPARKALKSSDGAKGKAKKTKRRASSTYKPATVDKAGPKMPLIVGDLTVESLGAIIPQQPYISDKHIWPVGFKSSRFFSSMTNPEQRVKYTSEITDGGDKPQFVVTAEDDPQNPIISYSPSGAWRAVLKKVFEKNGGEDSAKNTSVSGALRFGLAHPIVAQLVRELPNADKCKDFSGEYSSSPSNSPTFGRKRRFSDEEYSDSDEDYEDITKKQRLSSSYDLETSPTNSLFTSKQELEDLESAVATLQALKYCAIY